MNRRVFSRTIYLAAGTVLGLGLAVSAGAGVGASVTTLSMANTASVTPVACTAGPRVTATGSGTAYGTPNLLTMQIGVQTSAGNATKALESNNNQSKALTTALEQGGVKAADIQTSNLSINPTYGNGQNPKVTGYQVEDDLTVQVYNLSSAGSLIDAAAAKLGNDVRFNGLSFSVSDPSGPSAQARASAVHAAVAEAKAMASAAGASLGPLCLISDSGSSQPQPIFAGNSGVTSAQAATLSPVPLQAGSQQFSAQVTVTYQLG